MMTGAQGMDEIGLGKIPVKHAAYNCDTIALAAAAGLVNADTPLPNTTPQNLPCYKKTPAPNALAVEVSEVCHRHSLPSITSCNIDEWAGRHARKYHSAAGVARNCLA